jgi:hypothetical protein
METAVVAVKTVETAEALETVAVTLMTVVLTIKAVATLVMTTVAAAVTALIEAAVTERAAAVYWRGRWCVSNVSDVRTMWNITACEGVCIAAGVVAVVRGHWRHIHQ